jgi:Spy/CpxP family protein refolding chaperone
MNTVVTSVLVTLGVLAALRLLRALAFRRHLHRRGRGFMARRLLRRIDATPDQEKLFLEELESLRGMLSGLREDAVASRLELARAVEAEALDAAALDALIAPALGRVEATRARAVQALTRFHAALAPAQRLQLATLLRSPAGLRAHHHGHC